MNLKEYLAQDAAVEDDSLFSRLGAAAKGAINGAKQGWNGSSDNQTGGNGQPNKQTSLEEHDKRFHKGGYKEGDTCKLRDSLKDESKSDELTLVKKPSQEESKQLSDEPVTRVGRWKQTYVAQKFDTQGEFDTAMRNAFMLYADDEFWFDDINEDDPFFKKMEELNPEYMKSWKDYYAKRNGPNSKWAKLSQQQNPTPASSSNQVQKKEEKDEDDDELEKFLDKMYAKYNPSSDVDPYNVWETRFDRLMKSMSSEDLAEYNRIKSGSKPSQQQKTKAQSYIDSINRQNVPDTNFAYMDRHGLNRFSKSIWDEAGVRGKFGDEFIPRPESRPHKIESFMNENGIQYPDSIGDGKIVAILGECKHRSNARQMAREIEKESDVINFRGSDIIVRPIRLRGSDGRKTWVGLVAEPNNRISSSDEER